MEFRIWINNHTRIKPLDVLIHPYHIFMLGHGRIIRTHMSQCMQLPTRNMIPNSCFQKGPSVSSATMLEFPLSMVTHYPIWCSVITPAKRPVLRKFQTHLCASFGSGKNYNILFQYLMPLLKFAPNCWYLSMTPLFAQKDTIEMTTIDKILREIM